MVAIGAERSASPVWMRGIEIAAAAIVYYALARASFSFASLNESVTPVWPPTGIAIALVLLRGNAMLAPVAVAALAANYAVTPSVLTAGAIALGNTLEAFVAVLLLNRWAGGERVFQSPVGVGKFAAIVTAVATPLSATIGVAALAATGNVAVNTLLPVWATWWLGDLAGAILLTPALVLWARTLRGEESGEIDATAAPAFAFAVVVGLVALSPLTPIPTAARGAIAFLVILPLLWSALRLGLRETATMALALSSFAVWGVVAGSSPFLQETLNRSLLLLIAFIVAATLPSLALAAERRASQAILDQTRQELARAQKLEALGQLTGGVAHDFNNLLSAISGGLATLERQHQERLNTMGQLKQALERGTGLTRQLLSFARREPVRLERINTAEALASAQTLILQSLDDTIAFEVRVGPGLWPVRADRNQFELAMLNLAVNARDAMPEGGALTILAENVADSEGSGVAIAVSDTGVGMSQEVIDRAFEPFFSTKPEGAGTGLGLAQVYNFVTQCGGAASIDSMPARGTTITITLPRA